MKKYLLTLMALPFLNASISQIVISGATSDGDSGESLPYVNIVWKGMDRVTMSDKDGKFYMSVPQEAAGDSLVFSYLGYETVAFPVSELAGTENEILLEPAPLRIPEVLVEKRKSKEKKAGHSNRGTRMLTSPLFDIAEVNLPDTRGREMGTLIRIKDDSRVNYASFTVAANQYKSVTFRFNLYAIEDGMPAGSILTENVIFEIKDEFRGWYKIDLTPYNIFLHEGDEVLASIELVDNLVDEGAKRFWTYFSWLPNTGVFRRNNISNVWEKINGTLAFYLGVTAYE